MSEAVQPFAGHRYSLVFFSINQYAAVPVEERSAIPDYPDEARMRGLKSLLAPARGYSKGGQQQSILENLFKMPRKRQCLFWPAVRLETLPKEVLGRILRFQKLPCAVSRRWVA